MAFKVRFLIGGICMYVQRKHAGVEALFVLFPPFSAHPHDLYFSPSGLYGSYTLLPNGSHDDLRTQLRGGRHLVPIPNLVRASQLTGVAVPEDYLIEVDSTHPWPGQNLGSRLVLPLPLGSPRCVNSVLASVTDNVTNETTELGYVSGQHEFLYEVRGSSLSVFGQTITGPATVELDFRPHSHGGGGGGGTRPSRTRMVHPEAHLRFLGNQTLEMRTEEPYKSVDPVDCASGGGCPPEQVGC